LISESRKRSALPFSRFERLVHRFYDWKQSSRRNDFGIRIFVGPSFDYDLETLKGVARLHARRGSKFRILNLGGLRIRRGDALNAWLEERRAAGIVGFHTSLAGCGETHDRWNGRAGDFDYQTSILRLGGERGMVRREKLFLTQNTLPIFDRLLDILDSIPGEVSSRVASPFFYAGLASRYESERLTEDERDNLPERINRLRPERQEAVLRPGAHLSASWRSRSARSRCSRKAFRPQLHRSDPSAHHGKGRCSPRYGRRENKARQNVAHGCGHGARQRDGD